MARRDPRTRTVRGAAAPLLALAVLAGTPGAVRPETAGAAPAPRHLRGLLEPAVAPAGGAGDPAASARAAALPPLDLGPVPAARSEALLSVPATGIGTVVGTADPERLATAPSGPGTVGALVFDVAGSAEDPWVLLARGGEGGAVDYGWVRAGPGRRLVPYERLVIDGLAFMRNGWDGRLHATPRDPVAHRVIPPSGGGAVRVVDAWMDPDDPGASWLLIVVFVEDSVCTDDFPVVVASGWVPAYRDDGGPAAWFHAEGC